MNQIENKKVFSLLLDFSRIEDKDKFLEFADKLMKSPKKIVSFVNFWYIFEYFLKFLNGKISLEEFIYLWDFYSKKAIYKNNLVFESLFLINFLLKSWKNKLRNSYILVWKEAVIYYSKKFDFEKLRQEVERLNSEIIVF